MAHLSGVKCPSPETLLSVNYGKLGVICISLLLDNYNGLYHIHVYWQFPLFSASLFTGPWL